MGKSGTAVPPPPQLSYDEQSLIQKQGLTLDNINSILSDSNVESQGTRDLLKNISGLYDESKVAGSESIALDQGKLDQLRANVDRLKNTQGGLDQFRDKEVPGWVLDELGKSGYDVGRTENDHNQTKGSKKNPVRVLDKFDALINSVKSDPDKLKTYGLAEVKTTPETSVFTPNKEGVSALRDRIRKNLEAQNVQEDKINEYTQQALDKLLGNAPKSPYQDLQDQIGVLEAQRYKNALEGKLPVSEATRQRKTDEFNRLKESLARTGNVIEGDDPTGAAGKSTSAIQSLGEFNRNWGLLEDAERHGDIAQGGATNLSRYGLTQDMSNQGFNQVQALRTGSPGAYPLSLATGAQGYGPQSLLPGYMNLSSAYGGALQPYQYQRGMQFQTGMQSAANDASMQAGLYQLLGTALGTGGTMAVLSSRKYKKDIKKMSSDEEDGALDDLSKRNLYRWNYKHEPSGDDSHTGMMVEEAPASLRAKSGEHLDVANYFGVLTSSIKSLSRKVDRLERTVH